MRLYTWLLVAFAWVVTIGYSTVAIFEIVFIRKADRFHALARAWARSVLRVFGVSVSLEGGERIQRGKTYIYVSNHASMFDIPAVLAGIPDDIHIMLKKELTRIPIWGWMLAMSPYIVIKRENARSASGSLEETASKIREGRSVLVFAEGTRTRTGALLPFKRGAFAVAAKAGVPVIPVTINNTFWIMQKGSLDVRPAPIRLLIGEPIASAGLDGRDAERRLMDETRRQIEATYVDQSRPANDV